jgi:hypothetical protein
VAEGGTGTDLTILLDPEEPAAGAPPVRWAAGALRAALRRRGIAATITGAGDAPGALVPAGRHILVTALHAGGRGEPIAERFVVGGAPSGTQAEARAGARPPDLRIAGGDPRGLVYALLEVAERVDRAGLAARPAGAVEGEGGAPEPDPDAVWRTLHALQTGPPLEGRPANEVRGVLRTFASDVEDLPLFHDRGGWERYLTALAAGRFNRLHLALGIGYDFARAMRDSYFYFPYPFLLDVPGYAVTARGVSAAERERNLDTLRFVAAETRRRGLHFQLGVWASVYVFEDSPDVNHPIEGLTPETHAAYCRDALRTLLQAVPEIDGVTLRIHGESGIPEGSYDFWEMVFAGVAGCGRRLELDLHSKGIDERIIDLALATGLPVTVSPKFWAEHLGLPYHQAEIRALEQPGPPSAAHGRLMALSTGSRRFTRYGYADLLREDRPYGVLFRVWPGTHRVLLWGDPVTGRGYGHAFGFAGARGVEIFEPLAFSGRRGSGVPDGHNLYAQEALRPRGGDWEKYAYTYRLWGRLLYDPAAGPEQWRPALEAELGPGAAAAEAALACASRILPLITTAHHPSAANNSYWPELYTDMPVVDGSHPHPYRDTPTPRCFATVSPLDPALFAGVADFVAERLAGRDSGRYGPADVARWLETLAAAARRHLATAAGTLSDAAQAGPAFRRLATDVRVEAALGRFFAGKLRAATGHALFVRTGDVASLEAAVAHYGAAREAWTEAAAAARAVYKADLTFGPEPHLRGHWSDRLPAIDTDLAALTRLLEEARCAKPAGAPGAGGDGARDGLSTPSAVTLESVLAARPPELALAHDPPRAFTPGAPLRLIADTLGPVAAVRLYYRQVNQAVRFQTLDLVPAGAGAATRFGAAIPAKDTDSPYPLQYYFLLQDAAGRARLWPGLDAAGPEPRLANQPYYVVRRAI